MKGAALIPSKIRMVFFKPMRKKPLPPAATQTEFSNELLQFMTELAAEGERAAVIGGAARVEVALEHLLKSVLHYNPEGSDNLFDPDRPLGTFSVKINLASRLGLLDDEQERALQMIRRTRNEFAHAVTHLRLTQPEYRDRVGELARCADTHGSGIAKLREESAGLFGNAVLSSFCISLALVTLVLEGAARENGPLKAERKASLNLHWS
jgi:hypothetical protein